ncbi:hypothetical protein CFELI_11735 [Corynebacterium felinum]|uniref:Uncharacterized protein n=1 Tax=Corynebacterium felinum TaxID=131318 RepID=A0ABU2B559_9CORY|nr:hypothetical protein [Corynebacterium felinum]WJY95929.1 hypothetical protein CFELI_11735 [Corynebacterium felinum]
MHCPWVQWDIFADFATEDSPAFLAIMLLTSGLWPMG